MTTAAALARGFRLLTQFANANPRHSGVVRCEMCARPLGETHGHVIDLAAHQPVCACESCALLARQTQGGRFARSSQSSVRLVEFAISNEDWERLGIPVQIAFFARSGRSGKIEAWYPSPGGLVRAPTADVDARPGPLARPPFATLEPDVEALLVDRSRNPPVHFLVPLEECYRLGGLLRRHWRGMSGGSAVRVELSRFFAGLEAKSEDA